MRTIIFSVLALLLLDLQVAASERTPSKIENLVSADGAFPVSAIELKKELNIGKVSKDTDWFYLGSTKKRHIFAGIFWSEPAGKIIDNDEQFAIVHRIMPVHRMISVDRNELMVRKIKKFTTNSKKWRKLSGPENL